MRFAHNRIYFYDRLYCASCRNSRTRHPPLREKSGQARQSDILLSYGHCAVCDFGTALQHRTRLQQLRRDVSRLHTADARRDRRFPHRKRLRADKQAACGLYRRLSRHFRDMRAVFRSRRDCMRLSLLRDTMARICLLSHTRRVFQLAELSAADDSRLHSDVRTALYRREPLLPLSRYRHIRVLLPPFGADNDTVLLHSENTSDALNPRHLRRHYHTADDILAADNRPCDGFRL